MAYYTLPNYAGTATGTGAVANPSRSYDASPDPNGIAPEVFGGKPGTVDVPNIYGQLTDIIPTLPATNLQLGQNTLNKAQGRLSPEQIRNVQDYSARFGISSGMPMSELATNLGARTIGTETAAIQQQGLQDYASLIPTIYKTQIVDPEVQIKLAMWNAKNKAEEDPFYGWLLGGGGGGEGGGGGGGIMGGGGMGAISSIAGIAGLAGI